MIAIPAVDLRDGKCVQLVGGDYNAEHVRLDDPRGVARSWVEQGFGRLHLVDLDAATGRAANNELVRDILRDSTVPVQVGGGIRDESRIEELLEQGATWIVVGTRAIEDEDWRREMAERYAGRLIVAADVKQRYVVTRGWTRTVHTEVVSFVEELSELPLAGVLVTAVHMEGKMEGTDLTLMEDVAEASAWPLLASGGVTSIDDMRALEHRGVSGAVIGMALYTGAVEPRRLAEEFAQ
jgi:phosphoribosylformimino-5-aminoimidazole carboxamide ribotide isomerase